MIPTTTYRSVSKQHKLRQILLLLVFSILLLVTIPLLYQTPFSNPFQYLLSPLCSLPPQQPVKLPSENETIKSTRNRTDTSNCDIFSGDWVPDPEALYYTNTSCSMIQENRNCLMYGRPNTEFLNWRWRPDGCELPRFDPNRFLEMMRGKSMAFVGDSLAKNHMQSLLCILSSVDYPRDISQTTDDDFKQMFYEKYNFTISVFWSPFLVTTILPAHRNLNGLWTLHLDEPDENWISDIAGFDYVIISDGNWFVKRAMLYESGQLVGCSSCQEQDVTDLTVHYINRKAFRTAFSALNRLEAFKGMIIMRTLSPDHFEGGEWDTGGDCGRTRPYHKDEVSLDSHVLNLYKAQIEEFREAEKEGGRRGLKYKLIDATQAMLLRPDGHPSRYAHWPQPNVTFRNDCVHWCLPGPIDVWNEFLYQTMSM